MYTSDDGLKHQSNPTFSVRQADMKITDGLYSPRSVPGYASHSFNQFILVDMDENIITWDHGDAYPRSAVLTSHCAKAGRNRFFKSTLVPVTVYNYDVVKKVNLYSLCPER